MNIHILCPFVENWLHMSHIICININMHEVDMHRCIHVVKAVAGPEL